LNPLFQAEQNEKKNLLQVEESEINFCLYASFFFYSRGLILLLILFLGLGDVSSWWMLMLLRIVVLTGVSGQTNYSFKGKTTQGHDFFL
jgi:hypothetical protein